MSQPANEPRFTRGDRVRVAARLTWRPGLAGRVGIVTSPPRPISWPSYYRTESKTGRRIYWVELDAVAGIGAVDGGEVDEEDLEPA